MCWPMDLQLWTPQCTTWTGSFPLQLDAGDNAACFAAGNQRMFDRWAWRRMADCNLLKFSPSQAAAKKKTTRAACAVVLITQKQLLAVSWKYQQRPFSHSVCDTWLIAICTHILSFCGNTVYFSSVNKQLTKLVRFDLSVLLLLFLSN